jgi:hypothetical protein
VGRKKSSPSVGRKSSSALGKRSRWRGEEEVLADVGEELISGAQMTQSDVMTREGDGAPLQRDRVAQNKIIRVLGGMI